MGKFKLGITHSGKPHLDDCMSYSVLEYVFGEFPLIRKDELVKKEIFDPEIVIFDTGMIFNRSINCFDHHQDERLPSSCLLLWREFAPEETEEEKMIKDTVDKRCLSFISDIDRGEASTSERKLSLNIAFHFMTFECKSYDEAFARGVDICSSTLRGLVAKIWKEKIGLNQRWQKDIKRYGPNNSIVSLKTPVDYLPKDWANLAQEEGANFVLTKSLRTFKTNLHGVSGIPIPQDRRQTYWEDGRKASYRTEDDAINHALEISIGLRN